MRRRLVTFFVATSLLLFLASVALYIWALSHPINVVFRRTLWIRISDADLWCLVRNGSGLRSVLRVPFAALIFLFGMPPFLAACGLVHSRRLLASEQSRGLCSACGYDLRATPDRCPECGRVAEAGGSA